MKHPRNSEASVWWLPLTPENGKMAAGGIYIKMAAALMWGQMPLNGQRKWRAWGQVRFY